MSRSAGRARHVVLLVVILLLAQEAALRALFPLPELVGLDRIDYSIVQVSPGMSAAGGLANRSFTWSSAPDDARSRHLLNGYGFRDDDWPLRAPGGVDRVLFVGDSMVEGMLADAEQAIPQRFQALAGERGLRVESLNGGIATAGLPEYLRFIRDAVPWLRPTRVVLVIYANDLPAASIDPDPLAAPSSLERASAWTPRLLEVVMRIGSERPLPVRWRGDPFPFFSAVPHPANPWSNPEFDRSRGPFVEDDIETAMKQGSFNPFVVDEHSIHARRLSVAVDLTSPLGSLSRFLAGYDADLMVVYLPTRSQVSDAYLEYQVRFARAKFVTSLMGETYQQHARGLGADCAALDISFLDLTSTLRQAEMQGRRLYWDHDEHMRPDGYERVARTILDHWPDR